MPFSVTATDTLLAEVALARAPGDVHPQGVSRHSVVHALGPLHGAHAAPCQIVLPADVEQLVRAAQPVHIKVKQRCCAVVFVDNGKRGAGDPSGAAQTSGQPTGKGGLAHAQSAAVGHHCTGAQPPAQHFADMLCLLRTVGQIFHRRGLLYLKSTYYSTPPPKRKERNHSSRIKCSAAGRSCWHSKSAAHKKKRHTFVYLFFL